MWKARDVIVRRAACASSAARPRGWRCPWLMAVEEAGMADRIGVEATDEETADVLLKVKDRSLANKALLTVDEFRDIVDKAVA